MFLAPISGCLKGKPNGNHPCCEEVVRGNQSETNHFGGSNPLLLGPRQLQRQESGGPVRVPVAQAQGVQSGLPGLHLGALGCVRLREKKNPQLRNLLKMEGVRMTLEQPRQLNRLM